MFQKARLLCLVLSLTFCSASLNSPRIITAEEILDLVNQDREKHGLSGLDLNSSLNMAAGLKAMDMVEKNYFAHVSPQGLKPWHWFKVIGYNYTYAGENLAIGFSDASELERTWMASASHRANILSPVYSELGLAVAKHDDNYVVVQFFGSEDDKLTLRQ